MGIRRDEINYTYDIGNSLLMVFPIPIVTEDNPGADDMAQIGQVWVNKSTNTAYMLTGISGGLTTWTNLGGGGGVFASLTVDPGNLTVTAGNIILPAGNIGLTAGDIILDAGDLTLTLGNFEVSAGSATIGAFGVGVVTSSAAGLLSSTAGTNGQVIIGATAGAPIWANILPGAGIAINNAANSITIVATGATASSYITDIAGPVTPDGTGAVTVLGGTNFSTDGTVANTITLNVIDAPVFAGLVTCQLGVDVSGADAHITSITNVGQDIYLHADGGAAETIEIYSDQGTGTGGVAASVYVHSDVGGVTIESGVASADAVSLWASDAVGGIDLAAGFGGINGLTTGTFSIDSQNDSDITVTGPFDLTLATTGGSVVLNGGDGAADAIRLLTTDAAGGIDIDAGTGGISIAANNGAIAITSGTGAINIGADAAAHTVTLGTTNTTGRTVVQSGTGDLALTSTDAITLDAVGVLELNSSAGVIGIGNDAIAQNINVGTGAAARTITLGNVTGATAVTVNVGTGDLNLGFNTGTDHVTYIGSNVGASQTGLLAGTGGFTVLTTGAIDLDATGVLEINSSAGVIGIGNDAIAQNINIGTGAAARVITVGNATGATSVVINAGTGAVDIGANAIAHTTRVGSVTGAADTTVQAGTGALTFTAGGIFDVNATGAVTIDSTGGTIGLGVDADAQNINVGTGAAARVITIGNVTGATGLSVYSGTGGVDISSTGTGDIVIDSDDTLLLDADGVLELNSSAGVISIGNDANAQNINVGTGAAARVITIGNVTGATALALDVGTGLLDLGYLCGTDHSSAFGSAIGTSATDVASGTGGMTLASQGAIALDAVGTLEFNSSGAAIGIGNDANAFAVNVGTGAAARTITIGNATGTTSVVVNAGTGNVDLGANATAHTTTVGSVTTTSRTVIQSGTGDLALTSTDDITLDCAGILELNSNAGNISIGNDPDVFDIYIGSAGAGRGVYVGNTDGATVTEIYSGTGGIDLLASNGNVAVYSLSNSVAGTSLTLNCRVGHAIFTGQTTGAGATLDLTITNSMVAAGGPVIVTVSNKGTNDADMSLEGVITQTAGTLLVHTKNNGSQALNGDVMVTFWML